MGKFVSWDDIVKIKNSTRLPIVLKGIHCAADAEKKQLN